MTKMKVKKRLFFGLALGALLLSVLLLFVVWYLVTNPNAFLSTSLMIAGWLVIVLLAAGLVGITLLAFSLLYSRPLGVLTSFTFKMLNNVYPLVLALSKALKLDTDLVRRSYVEVHNQATKYSLMGKKISRILILAPHCLQKSECPNKITIDINNCKRCGQCPIDGLIRIADTYKLDLAVATGGTLARECVKRYKPEAVLAIACERDLVSGIQDVSPLPVFGVLNKRPYGPCRNTQVDFADLEYALSLLRDQPSKVFVKEQGLTGNMD